MRNVYKYYPSFIAILFAVFFVIPTSTFSQPSETIKYLNTGKIKGFAKNSERVGDTYSAIEYYEKLFTSRPNDMKIAMSLGKLYQKARNYPMAREYYSKVFENDKNNYPEALYYQALMEKMMGDYDKAKEDFQKFNKVAKSSSFDQDYKKLTKNEIEGCDLAKQKMNSALKVVITHLDTSINKAHVEMSPYPIDKNQIIYASLKADKVKYIDLQDPNQKMPVRQIYTAKKVGDKWVSSGIFDGPFNLSDENTCNGTFSPDGNRFYFTRCHMNWKNIAVCEIYESKKTDGTWSDPEKLDKEINNPKFTSTQPTVGTDSKYNSEVLYFVSDREGGKGGLDIWFSAYNNKSKTFKPPKNAGNKINTIGDEVTPFYDMSSRTMYFSSNGWPSMGGFDVFKSSGELSTWINPSNIGYPINSSTDDIYFVVEKNKEEGFVVSNRKGGVSLLSETCCDDIYEYTWSEFIHVGVTGKIFAIEDSSIYLQLEHQITENKFINDDDPFEKINPLSKQAVNLFLVDENKERIFIKADTTTTEGEYFFDIEPGKEYKIVVENFGMFNKELNIDTRPIIKSDTLRLDAIYINTLPKDPIVIKNIYYEFSKWNLTDSSKATLDTTLYKLMLNNPRIIVELSSHTDSVSSDEFNIKLSQKRAESVVQYLIDKGIEKERLYAKGYGETKPIARNTNPDGSDNPVGRQKNRRTEFRIIGSLDQYSKVIYEE